MSAKKKIGRTNDAAQNEALGARRVSEKKNLITCERGQRMTVVRANHERARRKDWMWLKQNKALIGKRFKIEHNQGLASRERNEIWHS